MIGNMTGKMKAVLALLGFAALAGFSAAPAHARGGGANLLNSPGYQRALEESRKARVQAYTTPPAVYPGRKWRHRRHHH